MLPAAHGLPFGLTTMRSLQRAFLLVVPVAAFHACGSGSGGSRTPPEPAPSSSHGLSPYDASADALGDVAGGVGDSSSAPMSDGSSPSDSSSVAYGDGASRPPSDASGAEDTSPPASDASGADGGPLSSSGGPGFPRLGSLDIATVQGQPNGGYDSGYVQWASKLHVHIIGANWAGGGASLYGGSREAFVRAIHGRSTIGARVFQYFDADNNQVAWPPLGDLSKWILYQHGTSGPCASNSSQPNFCNTNETLYPPADADGLHLEGEFARALVSTLVAGSGVDSAPSMDGTFHDNTVLTPQVAGDYARNGTEEPVGDPTAGAWLRAGLAE